MPIDLLFKVVLRMFEGDASPEDSFYDPPYDSPLEDLFAYNIVKYLNPDVSLNKQVEVNTICGKFFIDFVATLGSKRIAFECDGKEFHNQGRDEWRDAMILGDRTVDIMYHFRGSDLEYHLEDCLFIVSKFHPEIFSKRGLINLERLASEEARKFNPQEDDELLYMMYRDDPKGLGMTSIWSVRRTADIPEGRKPFWRDLYDFARERGGGNLDALIAAHKEEAFSKAMRLSD